jgi:tetratricopeptide (TPR) repeat protein
MKLPQHPFNASLGFKFTRALSNPVCLCLLLVAATLLAYQPVWHAGFIWDDDAHLTKNPYIVGPLGFWGIWTSSAAVYYPLVLTSFWAQHALWGLNPLPYHLVNISLHAANALLVWRLLRRLSVPGAWLGAALWALHPVQVESVAWITELKNTQSCFFYLLAILFFLKWRAAGISDSWRREEGNYALALLCAILAILSKASTVMLPVVFGLCWWWMDGRWRWRNSLRLVPLILISIMASGWTIWEQQFHSGAQGPEWAESWPERFIIAGKVIWFYLGKLLWPHPLIFIYPRWKIDASQLVAYLPVLVAVFTLFVLWLNCKGRLRSVYFAWTYFVVSLFPVLDFFKVYFFRYSFVGDHFQYLASIGPIALVGAGIVKVIGHFEKRTRFLRPVFCGALLLTLGVLTWRQSATYVNAETLWRTTLARNPDCWMAYNNLGSVLAREGKFDQAISYSQKSLEIEPKNAEAYKNLGLVLAQKGEMDGAISLWQKSLEIEPDDAKIHYDLGVAYFMNGQTDKAIVHFQKALEIQPDFALAHNNLGLALFEKGWMDKAIVHYRKALEIQPDYATAHNNLGFALFKKGRVMEAIIHWQKTLELQPQNMDARNNLAWVLATCPEAALRNGGKAVELAQQANQLSGGENPMLLQTLAAAYAEVGRFHEAITTARRALQLATTQTNSDLINNLRAQTGFYEAGLPFHDTNQTNIQVHSNQP